MNHRLSPLLITAVLGPAFAQVSAPAETTSDSGVELAATCDDVLAAINADSLRGHLSFIASDLLGGRDTPSRGLTIASEYIAAQFRRAGLEPIGDDGYFQTTTVTTPKPDPSDFACTLRSGDGRSVEIATDQISIFMADEAIDLTGAPLVQIDFESLGEDPGDADPDSGAGDNDATQAGTPVVITRMPSLDSLAPDERRDFFARFSRLTERARDLRAAAVLAVDDSREAGSGLTPRVRRTRGNSPAFIYLHGKESGALYDALDENATVDLHYALPREEAVEVRNVAGLLRGSDPDLADTYILVTAHYDHLGAGTPVDGDRIYNGANDDGSGTVSVIELANAFGALEERPRRSIVFMCFYGEEKGLLGSRHYVQNPLVPLEKTIANVNLEHVGRTDDVEGESVNRIMPTGYDFSSLVKWFEEAGETTGVEMYHHPRNSASFFTRSDNAAFAGAGIPAHTFCAAFIFPDYHGAKDHWQAVDYENMAQVNRTIALGLWNLANDDEVPQWDRDHPRTGRFLEAWETLHREARPGEESDAAGSGD